MRRASARLHRPLRILELGSAVLLALASSACTAMSADRALPLVWHAETMDGKVIESHESDKPVNPASVTKLATSLRALDTLGPDKRFETSFEIAGDVSGAHGSLVVRGGADPDFHFENAMLVGHALNAAGLRHLHGDLFVSEGFWMGWERGTAGREPDPQRRRLDMGHRLLEAWNSPQWSAEQKQAWAQMAARRNWDPSKPPELRIDGRVRIDEAPASRAVLVHRSEPLLVALRRFNVFSNNDIERLDDSVGPAADLSAYLHRRWGDAASVTSFSTSSGLNRNRITPRLAVRLLHDLRAWLAEHGHTPADLMPVLGCGESTLPELFPRLRESGDANGLIGKTGTLNVQDGGVSALAGFLPAGDGVVFFVAAPGAGAALPRARAEEEDWIERMRRKAGALQPLACPPPVPTSDALAQIEGQSSLSAR